MIHRTCFISLLTAALQGDTDADRIRRKEKAWTSEEDQQEVTFEQRSAYRLSSSKDVEWMQSFGYVF